MGQVPEIKLMMMMMMMIMTYWVSNKIQIIDLG